MSKSITNVYHKTTHRTGKNSKFISYTKLSDGEVAALSILSMIGSIIGAFIVGTKPTEEEVIETPEELTDEDIKSIILEKAKDYNITLKEEDTNKIVEITNKLQKLEYDVNAFTSQLKKTESALEGAGQEISNASKKATGFFGKIKQFFVNIINWFKNLFSSKNVTNDVDNTEKVDTTESSIFDNVDTDVFKFDGEEETESNIETVEETESISTDTESSDNSNTELEDNVEIERY